jgi:AraC family transcriptional regulator
MTESTIVRPRGANAASRQATVVAGARACTRVMRQEAVERAVRVMRERFAEPLPHEEIARAALLSQYHFNRVFRLVTGVSPGRFLTAVRMAEARRLLLTTRLRVTDVCFAVGFEGLGTFTTRFGQLVGLAPQQLRFQLKIYGDASLADLAAGGRASSLVALQGRVQTPETAPCFALVGLFPTGLPHNIPAACTPLWASGGFTIGPVKPGAYHVLALAFPAAATVREAMHKDPSQVLVGRLERPVHLVPGARLQVCPLRLRLPAAIDPPVVMAGPLLAALAQDKRTPRPAVLL